MPPLGSQPVQDLSAQRRLLVAASIAPDRASRSPWRTATFETLRRAFLKIAVRIEELKSRIKIALPSAYPYRKAMIAMAGAARRTRKIKGIISDSHTRRLAVSLTSSMTVTAMAGP